LVILDSQVVRPVGLELFWGVLFFIGGAGAVGVTTFFFDYYLELLLLPRLHRP